MDGKELLYGLRELLNEDSTSPFMDDKTSYNYLWQAATEFVERTNSLKSSQSITTVADQTTYDLDADFIKIWQRDREERAFIQYNDGTNTTNIYWKDYGLILFDNNTTSVTIPDYFTIRDEAALDSKISSTATSTAAATAGECTLTDTTADFSDVKPGDIIHNVTDGSDGVVTEYTSSTAVKTALFNGTDDDWTSGDSYVLVPQAKLAVVFDPPPSVSGHTVTVAYIQRPGPVYTDYSSYRIPQRFLNALIKYAAWLYKYRDDEPDTGDKWFQYWDNTVVNAGKQLNDAFIRRSYSVNLKKSESRSQSAR